MLDMNSSAFVYCAIKTNCLDQTQGKIILSVIKNATLSLTKGSLYSFHKLNAISNLHYYFYYYINPYRYFKILKYKFNILE